MNIEEYLSSGKRRTVNGTAIVFDKDRNVMGIASNIELVIDPSTKDIIKKGGFSFDHMKSGVVETMQIILEDNPEWSREQKI